MKLSALLLALMATAAVVSAQNGDALRQCQVNYGIAISEAATQEDTCRAIHNLAICFKSILSITPTEAANAQAFLDSAQFVTDCSAFDFGISTPTITVHNNFVTFEVDRERDVRFFRKRRDEQTSIWALHDEIQSLASSIREACTSPANLSDATATVMAAFSQEVSRAELQAMAALEVASQSLVTLTTTVTQNAVSRADNLAAELVRTRETVEGLVGDTLADFSSEIGATTSSIETYIVDASSSAEQRQQDLKQTFDQIQRNMNASLSTTISSMENAVAEVNTALDNIRNEHTTLRATLSTLIDTEVNLARGHVYVRFGRGNCPPNHELLHAGITYGAHHNHNGAPNQICLTEAPSGGAETGTSSLDILYPLGLGGNSGTNLPTSRIIRCARCHAPRSGTCFRMEGTASCPSGFTMAYRGYLVGAHYTHASSAGRFCVDEDFDGSYGNTDDYVYPTRVQEASANIPAGPSVRCVMCCKE
eukprot:m.225365 g.225365  ORF g.225365 m.225365 type:complete len:479 (-) comp17040_c5_seq1:24-1460(-)